MPTTAETPTKTQLFSITLYGDTEHLYPNSIQFWDVDIDCEVESGDADYLKMVLKALDEAIEAGEIDSASLTWAKKRVVQGIQKIEVQNASWILTDLADKINNIGV